MRAFAASSAASEKIYPPNFAKDVRFATTNDLYRAEYPYPKIKPKGLSRLAKRWVRFLCVYIYLGFDGIKASIGAITEAEYLAADQTKSERTTYRALAQLEKAGLIRRQKLRIGENRFLAVIHFEEELLSLARSPKILPKKAPPKIIPLIPTNPTSPTPAHKNPQVPNRQYVDRTNISTKERSSYSPKSYLKEQRARVIDIDKAREAKNKKDKRRNFSTWIHPILFTLKMILTGPVRMFCLDRAKFELENPTLATSGAEWSKWTPKWQTLDISMREHIAETQFVPLLADKSTLQDSRKKKGPVDRLVSSISSKVPAPKISQSELERMRQNLRIPVEPKKQETHIEIDLKAEDYQKLLEAKRRVEQRRMTEDLEI